MAGDSSTFRCDRLPRWGPQEEQQSQRRGLECKDTSSREGREEKTAPERRPTWLLWRRRVRRDGRCLGGDGQKAGKDTLICPGAKQNSSRDKETGRQTPEGLWVDVGQLRVVGELQFDDARKILES